jgi:glyoxylase-like metal-dependent hydrolase (beta-lactamase superfamily II)
VYARLHDGLTNAGIIVGDAGVLVIDSLRVPSFARDLIQDVRHITEKPVQYVIDTHAHWDHSWGNEEFPEATIIGHQNCYREMLDVEWNKQWREKVISDGLAWSEEARLVNITPPSLTFETSMRLYFGGRELELMYLGKAHTSGDIFIHLPAEKLIFTGDVIQDRRVPYLGDSYPAEWPDTDDRLVALSVEHFVSGHGPIGNHHGIVESRDFIHDLVGKTRASIQEGRSKSDTSATVVNALSDRYADWVGFESLDEKVQEVYQKLKG